MVQIFIFHEGWFEALLDQEQRREDGQLSRARPLETESAIPCPHPSIRCSASAHIHICTYNCLRSAVRLFVHLSIRLSASKDGSLPSPAHILVSGVPPQLTFTSVHTTGCGQLSVCLFNVRLESKVCHSVPHPLGIYQSDRRHFALYDIHCKQKGI